MSEPWWKRRQDARLRALRQLSPGAVAGEPDDPEATSLLRGLMTQPGDADLPEWLTAEHRRLTARVALRAELQQLGWAGRGLAREEDLVAAVAALRRDPRLAADAIAWSSDHYELLANLLAAPESPDPVSWIAEHRAVLAAELVLGEIAGQVAKDYSFDVGQVRQVLRPPQRATAGDLGVALRRIEFGTSGTLIVTDVTIPVPVMRRETLADGTTSRIVTDLIWRGFDEMRDDRGYYYLMARYEEDLPPRDSGGFRTKSARQSCFPAITSAVTHITLSCSGYCLFTIEVAGQDPPHVEFVPAPLTFELSIHGPDPGASLVS